jgi:hypothetical protein
MSQPTWRRYQRFYRDNIDADLHDEFSAHLALLVDAHVAAGLPRAAAESAARAAFANANAAMEECRKLTVARLARDRRRAQIQQLHNDARQVARDVLAQPAHTIVLIAGIAAVVAMSAIFTALLRARGF